METKFKAFISYRHLPTDIAAAKRLHRRIERYSVPKALRKDGSKRIGRVFRDKDELPMCGDLSENIRTALDNSEYLIIICTPMTEQSEWVKREISYFIETHDRDHVLLVLAAGTPETSFPALVTERRSEDGDLLEKFEPLAANISPDTVPKGSHAFATESLRILAALLGCSFDTLFKREQRYKRRRLSAVIAATAAVALCFIGMLLNRNAVIRSRYEQALINQSVYLANESVDLANNGDYYGATYLALQALPDTDRDRPLVSDAELALQLATKAYSKPGLIGVGPTGVLSHSRIVKDYVVDKSGKYLCSLSEDNVLTGWDTDTMLSVWKMQLDRVLTAGPTVAEYRSFFKHTNDAIQLAGILNDSDLLVWNGFRLMCVSADSGTKKWDLPSDACVQAAGDSLSVSCFEHVCVSERNNCIVAATNDHIAWLDGNTGEIRSSFIVKDLPLGIEEFGSLSKLAVSADGSRVAFKFSCDKISQENVRIGILNADGSIESISDDLASGSFLSDSLVFGEDCLYYSWLAYDSILDSTGTFWGLTKYSRSAINLSCMDLQTGSINWTSEYSTTQKVRSLMLCYIGDFEPTPVLAFAFGNHLNLVDPVSGALLKDAEFSSAVKQIIPSDSIVRCLTEGGGYGGADLKDASDWNETNYYAKNAYKWEKSPNSHWVLSESSNDIVRYQDWQSDPHWTPIDVQREDEESPSDFYVSRVFLAENCCAVMNNACDAVLVSDGDPAHTLREVTLPEDAEKENCCFQDGTLRLWWVYKKVDDPESGKVLYIRPDTLEQTTATFSDPDKTILQLFPNPTADQPEWVALCKSGGADSSKEQLISVCLLDHALSIQAEIPLTERLSFPDLQGVTDTCGNSIYVFIPGKESPFEFEGYSTSSAAWRVDLERQTVEDCTAALTAAFDEVNQEDKIISDCVCFDASAEKMTVRTDHMLRVFRSDGTECFSLESQERMFGSATFSPDGRYLLTAEDDSYLRRYEPADGAFLGETLLHINAWENVQLIFTDKDFIAVQSSSVLNLVREKDWSVFAYVSDVYAYNPERDFLFCNSGTNSIIGGFYRYSTQELIEYGKARLNGWEMSEHRRRAYGLE